MLFTSGYTQNAIVHNGRLDEGVELLSKPYRKDDLARKLRSMLQQPGSAAAASIVSMEHPVTGNKKSKVLIVEDSALIRMTIVDMVEEIGLRYAEAGAAQEALGILAADPDINVLLTDLGLPGMSGAELIHQAVKLRPGLKIVVASGYSEPVSSERGSLGEAVYLQKPFTLPQLREALDEV